MKAKRIYGSLAIETIRSCCFRISRFVTSGLDSGVNSRTAFIVAMTN